MNFRLDSLELYDFMGFKEKRIDFSKLTLLVGENGTGKSAILEALALSFQIKERGNAVNNYIRQGCKKATVILHATWMGKPLEIESVFAATGRKITRTLKYEGNVYENMMANNFLTEYFDSRNLTISFALQGNDKFLSASKMQNLKNLTDLLQIDFNDEVELVKARLRTVTTDKDEALTKLHKHTGAKSAVEESIKDCISKIEYNERQLTQYQEVEDYSVVENEVLKLKSELNELLKAKDEVSKKQIKYKECNDILLKDRNTLQSYKTQLDNLPQLGEVQDVNPWKEKVASQSKNLDESRIAYNQMIGSQSELKANIKSEKERLDKIANGLCPTCHQPVEAHILEASDHTIQEFQTKLAEIEKSMENQTATISQIKTEIESLTKQISSTELNNNNISHNAQVKKMLEDSINNLNKKIVEEEQRKNELEQELGTFSEDEKVTQLRESIAKKEEFVREAKKKIEVKAQCKANIQSYKNVLDNLQMQKTESEQQIELCELAISKDEKEIAKLNRKQDIFTCLPKIHLQEVLSGIQFVMNELVSHFGFKGLRIECDDKGIDFYLVKWSKKDDGTHYEIPYFMCSAFQKNLINISLIVAMSKFFDLPFICADEIDSSASVSSERKLGIVISEALNSCPMVTISHSEGLVTELIQKGQDVSIVKLTEVLGDSMHAPDNENLEEEDLEESFE